MVGDRCADQGRVVRSKACKEVKNLEEKMDRKRNRVHATSGKF